MHKILTLLAAVAEHLEERSFPPGTVRRWKNGDFQKQPDGTWLPVTSKSVGSMGAIATPPETARTYGGQGHADDVGWDLTGAAIANSREKDHFPTIRAEVAAALTILKDNKIKKKKKYWGYAKFDNQEQEDAIHAAGKSVREGTRLLLKDFGMVSRDEKFGRSERDSYRRLRQGKRVLASHSKATGAVEVSARAHDAAEKFFHLKKGKAPTIDMVKGVISIVHEEVHGCSPIHYSGTYSAIEEATTELSARKIVKEGFGVPMSLVNEEIKPSYEYEVEALRLCTMAALWENGISTPEKDRDWWQDFMGEAAIEMRRQDAILVDAEPAKRFAKALPIPPSAIETVAAKRGIEQSEVWNRIIKSMQDRWLHASEMIKYTKKTFITKGFAREIRAHFEATPNARLCQHMTQGTLMWVSSEAKPPFMYVDVTEKYRAKALSRAESRMPSALEDFYAQDFSVKTEPGVYDLARNDLVGAYSFAVMHADTITDDELSVLLNLQDDATLLRLKFEELFT